MQKYTVIMPNFGGYDIIRDTQYKNKNFDFVCVTDNVNRKSDTWRFVTSKNIKNEWSGRKKTYYVKYHPFEFCNTENVIYIDGSIELEDLTIILAKYEALEYERIFQNGMTARSWIYGMLLNDSFMREKCDADYLTYVSEQSRILCECLYEKNLSPDEVVHHRGCFYVAKNNEINRKNFSDVFDFVSTSIDKMVNKKLFDDDVFLPDELPCGIMFHKNKEKTLYINSLPCKYFEHNGFCLRTEKTNERIIS